LQTALLGRAAGMNAVRRVRSVAVLGNGLGRVGLLLAFPIMAALKIVFGEVERLKPLATLMSD
jgi:predicted PurR-regulated permease PerM